ncbi:MAG: nucleotidyltransferase domain-containing protein [Clostridiales bacterium]|nr:nucleotidyltransferase domain-containing protein [Clostridiales bacterium]
MPVNGDILEMTDIIRNVVPTERIYLFGSHAYGVPGEHSDYDLYVVLSDESLRPYDAEVTIRRAFVGLKKPFPVDILAMSAAGFDNRKGLLTLERKVANEGVLLYERDRFDIRMA